MNRNLVASNKSKSYVVSSKRKLALPNGSAKSAKRRGGKQMKCKNFRNKKSNHKTRKNKGCIS